MMPLVFYIVQQYRDTSVNRYSGTPSVLVDIMLLYFLLYPLCFFSACVYYYEYI